MAIDSIGGAAQANSATALTNSGLGQEDFLKILLAQLSYQDPLKPMDNQEFMAQMAEFSGLELTRQNNDKVDTLLAFQAVNQAVGLIGKEVEVRTDTGAPVVGTVTTITFNNGTPLLNVNSTPPLTGITMSQISIVRQA